MKHLITYSTLALLFFNSHTAHNSIVRSGDPVAIIELFTSQGCASCPAADKLLKDFLLEADERSMAVIGLSYHISYWNHLGWKDPYSKEEFSARQKLYSQFLGLSNIYTPQVIINGKYEMVGSDKLAIKKIIDKALEEPASYQISSKSEISNNVLKLDYTVNKTPNEEFLNVAIVETAVKNPVTAGENKGRKLSHNNVVRLLHTYNLQKEGKIELELPELADVNHALVVLYVQDSKTFHVVGGSKTWLSSTLKGN